MTITGNLLLNLYSIVILFVIGVHQSRIRHMTDPGDRLYYAIIRINMVMLVADILGRLDGTAHPLYPVLNSTGNFLTYLLNPVMPIIWFLYVHYQIKPSSLHLKRLARPFLLFQAVFMLVVIANLLTGWFYSIDSSNIYRRGPLFIIPVLIPLLILLIASGVIVVNRKSLQPGLAGPMLLFILPPIAGIILQAIFYGYSLILIGSTISILIVFLHVQKKAIHTDYLTGVNNRLRLQFSLQDRISDSDENQSFSAILLDVDNFKQINDRFGHPVGDMALRDAADLLRQCVRPRDFVARYGGDEFFLILDVRDAAGLERIVERIRQKLTDFNRSGDRVYDLGFSMGYAVYDPASGMDVKTYQQMLDQRMYEDKESRRAAARPMETKTKKEPSISCL